MRRFQKYQIIEGDTLDYVANKFKLMSAEELRSFHNTHCELNQMIGYELKPESIILIPSYEEIEQVNTRIENRKQEWLLIQRKVQLNEYKKLIFIPTQFNANYNVEIDQKNRQFYSFQIQMKWKERYLNKHIISIEFKGFESEEFVSAKEIIQLDFFQSLDILINSEGKFITIDNAPKIRTKWSENRAFLFEKYTDEDSIKYLNEFEQIIQNTLKINELLEGNIIIYLFFSDLYAQSYKSENIQKYKSIIPLIKDNASKLFFIERTLDEDLSQSEYIRITQKGKAENINFTTHRKEKINTEFLLNKNNGSIESLEANFNLFFPETNIINIKVNKL